VSSLARSKPMIMVCHELLPFMERDRTQTQLASFSEELFKCEHILYVSAVPPGPIPDLNIRRVQRDGLIAGMSSVLMVGRIRRRGNMERIVSKAEKFGKLIVYFSECEELPAKNGTGEEKTFSSAANVKKKLKDQSVREFKDVSKGSRFLIHYTRSHQGPWPGQNMLDYCRSLIRGEEDSGHSAFDSLMRIIKERRIRAGARLIRGKYPVVSLTECFPGEVSALTEWRQGLLRWSFEPYGIAFPLQALFDKGARPVVYAIKEAYDDLTEDLRYLFQLQSASGRKWSPEKEWRLKGDLRITPSLECQAVIIIKTLEEALVVRECCNIQTALARL
jgi:hypothetical protein